MNSIHDTAALEKLRGQCRVDPNCLRQFLNSFYKKHQTAEEVLRHLPEAQQNAFAKEIAFHTLELAARHDSRLDGASKLLFRTAQSRRMESVILRIASGRTSLCISSQVGCAAQCRFCATGHMGVAHHLTRDEILDQVIQANLMLRSEGRSIRNVVFMGMGEPFHNEGEVYKAVEILLSPRCFDLSPAHVLISTVGIPAAMVRCAKRFPRLGMALSLHSARQEIREQIIPLARRYPLDLLRELLMEVTEIQQKPVMIEYVLLDELNDTTADLQALIAYLSGLPVHINLIPYNPIDEAHGLRATPPDRRREFAAALSDAGFQVTIRYSLGADIAAACGQLARDREDNMLSKNRQLKMNNEQ